MTHLESDNLKATMRSHNICVIVPTYNNAGTISNVVSDVLKYARDVIVVDDGCTDATATLLKEFGDAITVVNHIHNKGKGSALKSGFNRAIQLGFDYAITIDADGQHYPSDIAYFVKAIIENPSTLIVGRRDLTNVDINGKSSFANKFSNFWFAVQTGRNLKDTQTGYRAYPLRRLYGLGLLTSRYEAELELLVFAAWNGVNILSIPIKVYYPPQSLRVSHFRPGLDFTRISILNTVLCLGAIVYGLPVRFYKCISHKKFFSGELKCFTRKNGEPRQASITFGRLIRSIYGISHFLFWSLIVFKPYAYLHFHLGKVTDKKKLSFHKSLQRMSSFFASHFPGSGTRYENQSNETFEKPALIICNHQSHLDLPVVMSVTPKMVILTNDWVWNNKYFGNIVHYADFLPVSAGVETILPRLKTLRDKGYSIMVFPEGTRSDDCSILRFHQGAFMLANELGLDVVPMVLHGAGNYLSKSDFMFRKGMITLRILPRIKAGTFAELALRKQASTYRKIVNDEFMKMVGEIETPTYFKSLALYKYAYRGWRNVARCKKTLRLMPQYQAVFEALSQSSGPIYFVNCGIGVIPLLYALSHRDKEVYGYEENLADYNTAVATADLPRNLHYKHVVWNDDYTFDGGMVCIIGRDVDTSRFDRYSPLIIPITV